MLNRCQPLRRSFPPGVLNTHHHHGNPDAHCADNVEFVVKDLFYGLRAGLRGANQDSGHIQFLLQCTFSLPQHLSHARSTGGPTERAGDRSAQVSWLVDGKENRGIWSWVPKVRVRNKGRKKGKLLLWGLAQIRPSGYFQLF